MQLYFKARMFPEVVTVLFLLLPRCACPGESPISRSSSEACPATSSTHFMFGADETTRGTNTEPSLILFEASPSNNGR